MDEVVAWNEGIHLNTLCALQAFLPVWRIGTACRRGGVGIGSEVDVRRAASIPNLEICVHCGADYVFLSAFESDLVCMVVSNMIPMLLQ